MELIEAFPAETRLTVYRRAPVEGPREQQLEAPKCNYASALICVLAGNLLKKSPGCMPHRGGASQSSDSERKATIACPTIMCRGNQLDLQTASG